MSEPDETFVHRRALRLRDGEHDVVTEVRVEAERHGERHSARARFVDSRIGSGRVGGATVTIGTTDHPSWYHSSTVVARALETLLYPRRLPTDQYSFKRYLDSHEVARMTHDEWDQAHRDGEEHLRLAERVSTAREALLDGTGELPGPFPGSLELVALRALVRDLDAGTPYEWAVRRYYEAER